MLLSPSILALVYLYKYTLHTRVMSLGVYCDDVLDFRGTVKYKLSSWSGSKFEESMPNTRTQTNMHSGLTTCVYYMPDRTNAQPNWQLGVSVRMLNSTLKALITKLI